MNIVVGLLVATRIIQSLPACSISYKACPQPWVYSSYKYLSSCWTKVLHRGYMDLPLAVMQPAGPLKQLNVDSRSAVTWLVRQVAASRRRIAGAVVPLSPPNMLPTFTTCIHILICCVLSSTHELFAHFKRPAASRRRATPGQVVNGLR